MNRGKVLKILLICYHYPPSSKVGAKRPASLVREFVRNGCEVDVVAPDERYVDTVDETLTVPGNVHRTPVRPSYRRNSSAFSFLRIPLRIWRTYLTLFDRFEGFVLPAFFSALKILRKGNHSAIIVSGPPFSPFISAWLASLFSGVPLVLEYRDPWSNLEKRSSDSALRRFFARQFERLISRRASSIVFVTDEMLIDFRERFEDCPAALKVIASGYTLLPDTPDQTRRTPDSLNILYSGKFYGERRIGLIASVLNDYALDTGTAVTMTVLGNMKSHDRKQFRSDAPEVVLDEKGFVSYREALDLICRADVLLLISGRDVAYAIPFKFYDYLGSGRPILTLAPEKSAMARMMKDIDCGAFARIDSSDQIASAFRKLASPETVCTGIGRERYTWSRIAADYLDLLRETLEAIRD